ncbi:hypothetical protein MKFW12EY_24750 [Methylomonas koyamae]|nr:hypothetical protein MKFW12EY_24750 [Methylomonas koyamae]
MLLEDNLIHHSDRGVQYISIRYTEGPAEASDEAHVDKLGHSTRMTYHR